MTRGPVPVIVTGVSGGAYGEQILKALRLAHTRYEIIAADMNPNSKGFADADRSYTMPPAREPAYLEELVRIAALHQARAIFPGSEVELAVLSEHRAAIRAAGLLLPINPASVIETCLDKARTFDFLERSGFAIPAWRRVRSTADLDGSIRLPAVLKPSVGGGGSANVFLAQSESDLRCFGAHLIGVAGDVVVQEYVGDPQSEYTAGVLLDMEGTLINSIAVHRDLTSALSTRIRVRNVTARSDLGPVLTISSGVSQGRIGRFPEVTSVAERVAVALGCQGAVNIQCRLVAGRPLIFEINPRFSGTTSIRALVGYNEPDVLVRKHVLGEAIEDHFDYGAGRVVRGLSETLLA